VTWSLNTAGDPRLGWLSLSASGVLSGTPPTYGTTPAFTVQATDSLSQIASRTLTFFVDADLDITPTTLREGVVLETQPPIPVIGGHGTRAFSLTSGSLPPGLTLTSSGGFIGTSTRHGTFNFSVHVVDCRASPSNLFLAEEYRRCEC